MSYQKNTWVDHITDPITGEVVQQGTKVTANRLNNLEGGVEKAHQLIESLAREWGGSFVTAQAGRNPGLVFSVAGLTASWTAGVAYVNGVRFDVASGSIALNASQGQYIYLDSDGIVKKTTSQATANAKCPLWYFATDASGVITSTDRRNIVASSITVDQNQAPTGNTGNWWKFFSFFANRLKQFSGETDWKTDPIRSLKQLWTDLSNHLSDTVSHITAAERTAWNAKETPEGAQTKVDNHASATSVHGATSAATASRIIMRDANGRAKVAAPSAADDIARKDTVDAVQANLNNHIGTGGTAHAAATTSAAGFMSASDKSKLDGATSAATSSTLIMRDANGRAKVAAPSAADDIARKDTVDAVQANLNNHIGTGGTAHAAATTSAAGFMSASDKSKLDGATSAATSSTLIMRDANGRAKVAAPAAPDDIARKDTVDSHANRTDNPHNVTSTQVNYIGSKAPTELSTVYPGGYSLSYIIPTDSNYNAWVDLANSLMGSAYSYDNTLMFVLKTDKAPTHRGITQELVILSNFTASSGQIWGVYKRSVAAYASSDVWGPWVRVDRGITYGTANPSGGRDGDIYFQYE